MIRKVKLRLADIESRNTKILLSLVGISLFLLSLSYWAINRVLQEESEKVQLHFSRLIESIDEHENFLRNASKIYSKTTENISVDVEPAFSIELIHQNDERLFQNHDTARSLPFTISQRDRYTRDQMKGVYSFGSQLTDYFTAFWSESYYSAPQSFVFTTSNKFTIALPGINSKSKQQILFKGNFFNISKRLYDQLLMHKKSLEDDQILWMRAPKNLIENRKFMMAATSIYLPREYIPGGIGHEPVILTTLLDISDITNLQRLLMRSTNTSFDLISPLGETLAGNTSNVESIPMGLSFGQNGLRIKLRSGIENYWTGLYEISYKSFFGYAKWSLLVATALLLLLLAFSYFLSRWYRLRIVEPAKQASEELAESEEFNRTILNYAPVGLCVVQRGTGTILLENLRAQQWQGTLELIKVLKRDYLDHKSGQVQIHISGRYLQACYALTRYKGKEVLLCGFNDITSHVYNSKTLDQARRDADSANKAKTIFLATMSHEIRTPLYGLLGNLELLELTNLNENQRNYLFKIQHSSATLLQIISDVLDVSKIESGQMSLEVTSFSPLEILENAIQSYSATAEKKGLNIFYCADSNLPARMLGDKSKINQIINNLLNNSIKFTNFGHVFLRLKVTNKENGYASLHWQVTDTGVGIPQHEITQLFTPFSQIGRDNHIAGAGLGLSICSRLSEIMGAELKVFSEPGLGSSFSLHLALPIVTGPVQRTSDINLSGIDIYVRAPFKEIEQFSIDWLKRWGANAQSIPSAENKHISGILLTLYPNALPPLAFQWHGDQILATAQGDYKSKKVSGGLEVGVFNIQAIAKAAMQLANKKSLNEDSGSQELNINLNLKVLVAEDNPINREVIKEQLLTLGVKVALAEDGDQALNKFLEEKFDLIITDVNMPKLDGYQLTREIRALDSSVPIIGVTANALLEEGEKCMLAGMTTWLVKPLKLKSLRETILAHTPQSKIFISPTFTLGNKGLKDHDG